MKVVGYIVPDFLKIIFHEDVHVYKTFQNYKKRYIYKLLVSERWVYEALFYIIIDIELQYDFFKYLHWTCIEIFIYLFTIYNFFLYINKLNLFFSDTDGKSEVFDDQHSPAAVRINWTIYSRDI